MTRYEVESEDTEYSDSDAELQEAFVTGKLKPGLNEVIEKPKKVFANKVGELKYKITEIKLNLPWIETLDLINKQAPLAPELAAQMLEHEQRRANQLKNNAKLPNIAPSEDPVINDFKREMLFHRQAQAAVMEGISKLKAMGIATKRPDNYFAEMAKTDEHMQKVREALMKKQGEEQRKEKVRHLRMQRKEGKAIQVQVRLKRQQEKKEMLDQVKKVRKGLTNNLDFLDNKGNKNNQATNKKSKKAVEKQKYKNTKYGFGGKKKGMKRNTKDSSHDVSEYQRPGKPNLKGKMSNKGAARRPGKNRRQQMKGKGKR